MFINAILQECHEKYFFNVIKIITCSMILSSCSALNLSDDLINVETQSSHYEFLEKLDNWEFRSRITIQTNEKAFSGRLHWIQSNNNSYLTINGALGFGAIKIEIDNSRILLIDNNGIMTEFENPKEDIFNFYGWHIPIKSLKYWLLGISNPLVEKKISVDKNGYLSSLQQGDWLLTVSRYKRYAGKNMPFILKINNFDTKITMVIDKWMLN